MILRNVLPVQYVALVMLAMFSEYQRLFAHLLGCLLFLFPPFSMRGLWFILPRACVCV